MLELSVTSPVLDHLHYLETQFSAFQWTLSIPPSIPLQIRDSHCCHSL